MSVDRTLEQGSMLDQQEAHDLVARLAALGWSPDDVWAERLNGRWVTFLRFAGRSYLVLPLLLGRAQPTQGAPEPSGP